MNRIDLIGNLGRDAEVKQFGERFLLSFNIATTETYRKKNGEEVTNTVWCRCSRWFNASPKVAQYLTKGTQVYVSGKASVSAYKSKEGEAMANLDVAFQELKLLGSKPTEKNQPAPQPAKADYSEQEDDLPF